MDATWSSFPNGAFLGTAFPTPEWFNGDAQTTEQMLFVISGHTIISQYRSHTKMALMINLSEVVALTFPLLETFLKNCKRRQIPSLVT